MVVGTLRTDTSAALSVPDQHNPPPGYEAPIVCDGIVDLRDVMVPMRDGKHLCVDIYRPDVAGKFPALLAIAPHNKEFQTPEFAEAVQWAQPAWSRMSFGGRRRRRHRLSGAPRLCACLRQHSRHRQVRRRRLARMGHVRSDRVDRPAAMVRRQCRHDRHLGLRRCAVRSGRAAAAPSLKAIFPYDSMGAYGQWGFRDFYPGGVIHTMVFLLEGGAVYHVNRGQPGQLGGEADKLWRAAMSNPDLMMYPNIFNIIVEKGQTMPLVYETVLNPYDPDDIVEKTKEKMSRIKIPFYTGSGWYAYTYKLHLQGSQQWFQEVEGVPKKLLLSGPAHLERPFHSFHDETCAGTTTGSKARTPALLTSRRSKCGSWARTSGAMATTGRCRKRSGASSTCTVGDGCDPSRMWPARATAGSSLTRSCRCRRRKPTRSLGCAT